MPQGAINTSINNSGTCDPLPQRFVNFLFKVLLSFFNFDKKEHAATEALRRRSLKQKRFD